MTDFIDEIKENEDNRFWINAKRSIASLSWVNFIVYCWLILLGKLGYFASAQNVTFLIIFVLFAICASVVASENIKDDRKEKSK